MKRLIAAIISTAIFLALLANINYILLDRTDHGVKQCIAMYEQPEDSIDVVVLGSSHVHYGVNTAELWEDYGISAYDFSSAEQPLWISYHYLKEICKTQSPKVVVLDFYAPAAYKEDYKYKYHHLAESFNGFDFSINKIQMMLASIDGQDQLLNKYFPGFFGYHDRYDQLTDEDFEEMNYDYENFKGFTPYFRCQETSTPVLGTDEIAPPTEKSQKYLQKIVDYTKENNIKLLITLVPYQLNCEQVTDVVQEEDKRYNWLMQYVSEQNEEGNDNVYFDYTLTHLDQIGIDFESGNDTFDGGHLNYYGSCKFSNYLGMFLRYMYGEDVLPDHREDPAYKSWDINAEEIRKIVTENEA